MIEEYKEAVIFSLVKWKKQHKFFFLKRNKFIECFWKGRFNRIFRSVTNKPNRPNNWKRTNWFQSWHKLRRLNVYKNKMRVYMCEGKIINKEISRGVRQGCVILLRFLIMSCVLYTLVFNMMMVSFPERIWWRMRNRNAVSSKPVLSWLNSSLAWLIGKKLVWSLFGSKYDSWIHLGI